MKKIIAIVVVIFVAFCGFLFYRVRTAPISIETIMPAHPQAYVRVSEIDKQRTEFQKSKLWLAIQKINVPRLLEKSGAPGEQIAQYKKFTSESYVFLSGLLLEKLFGQEVAVAVYAGDSGSIYNDPQAFLRRASDIILVTRTKPGIEAIDIISKICNKFNKKITTRQENYKGYTITIIEADRGFSIGYVKIKDLLVFGFGGNAARSSIDRATKTKPSLAQDAHYHSAMATIPHDAVVQGYADLKVLVSLCRLKVGLSEALLPAAWSGRMFS